MSYCRWSSDNFKCDIYAYESCYGGYQVHVASRRYKGEVPEVPNITKVPREEWQEAYRKQSEYLHDCGTEPIGLPMDGESFVCNSLEGLKTELNELKQMGYHVPEYVFERIEEEIE